MRLAARRSAACRSPCPRRFYGARANADLDNMVKSCLDALNGLAFADDRQLVCLSGCHKLPADADGPRAEIELWTAERGVMV